MQWSCSREGMLAGVISPPWLASGLSHRAPSWFTSINSLQSNKTCRTSHLVNIDVNCKRVWPDVWRLNDDDFYASFLAHILLPHTYVRWWERLCSPSALHGAAECCKPALGETLHFGPALKHNSGPSHSPLCHFLAISDLFDRPALLSITGLNSVNINLLLPS